MSFTKFLVLSILGIVGAVIGIKIVGALLGWALNAFFAFAVPAALVLGILYIVYRYSERKSLTGGGRSSLP